jgi:Tfp pilus assembly protein PilF
MKQKSLFYSIIKNTLAVLLLTLSLSSCGDDLPPPLTLAVGAEPSAKLRNDRGISHYELRRYQDALLQFMQAYSADKTAGEIHYNIALAYHAEGESEKAGEHFEQARKFARGNEKILSSELLNNYLNSKN